MESGLGGRVSNISRSFVSLLTNSAAPERPRSPSPDASGRVSRKKNACSIDKIPVEILSNILAQAAGKLADGATWDLDPFEGPAQLCDTLRATYSVCNTWRDVIDNNPHMWTSVDLSRPTYVQACIQRRQNVPIFIRGPLPKFDDVKALDKVLNSLGPIQTVTLTVEKKSTESHLRFSQFLDSISHSLVDLEVRHIANFHPRRPHSMNPDIVTPIPLKSSFPQVKTMVLHHVVVSFTSQLSKLTILQMGYGISIPLHLVAKVFQTVFQSPNLQILELQFSGIVDASEGRLPELPQKKVALLSLKEINVMGLPPHVLSAFHNALNIPNADRPWFHFDHYVDFVDFLYTDDDNVCSSLQRLKECMCDMHMLQFDKGSESGHPPDNGLRFYSENLDGSTCRCPTFTIAFKDPSNDDVPGYIAGLLDALSRIRWLQGRLVSVTLSQKFAVKDDLFGAMSWARALSCFDDLGVRELILHSVRSPQFAIRNLLTALKHCSESETPMLSKLREVHIKFPGVDEPHSTLHDERIVDAATWPKTLFYEEWLPIVKRLVKLGVLHYCGVRNDLLESTEELDAHWGEIERTLKSRVDAYGYDKPALTICAPHRPRH